MSMQTSYEWKRLLHTLITTGNSANPRDLHTLELLNFQSTVSMRRPIITQPGRNLCLRLMAAEAAWILSGDNRVYPLSRYAKRYKEFSDDGIFLRGAYGPKVVDQLSYVVDTLAAGTNTRQAVITTWRENPRPSKDIPCTLSMQFLIRNWELHMIVGMRSSDVWLGWPYDVFSFSMIAAYVLLMLRQHSRQYDLGRLMINSGSLHLYETNLAAARSVLSELPQESPELIITHFNHPEDLLGWLSHIRDAQKVDLSSFIL
jgi:thymidylate synthase